MSTRKSTPKTSRASQLQSPCSLKECSRCGLWITSNDQSKHTEAVCQSLTETGLNNQINGDSLSTGHYHGYIKGQTLFARLKDYDLKDRELADIPEHYHDRLLFLSPETFETLLLTNYDPVLIVRTTNGSQQTQSVNVLSHSNIRHPCTAWFYDKDVGDEEFAKVQMVKNPASAKSIAVEIEDNATVDAIDIISQLKKSTLNNRLVGEGMQLTTQVSRTSVKFRITKVINQQLDLIDSVQNLSINTKSSNRSEYSIVQESTRIIITSAQKVTFADVGGLDREITALRELIELPIKSASHVKDIGISPPKSVLVYGVPGVGKSLALNAFVNELGTEIFFLKIDAASILCRNETEQKLRQLFSLAKEQQPSVIIIDDIDILCASKKNSTDQEKKTLSTILTLLDNLSDQVAVIGITSRPESVDISLRRPGRLDREIEFPVPLAKHRVEILKTVLAKCSHKIAEKPLELLAESAYSFTGADLMLAVKEATLLAIKDNRNHLLEADLVTGLKSVKPSAMREIMLEVPKVHWTDIGGMHEVKRKMEQMVLWPLTRPEVFEKMSVQPPRGILMYGPPGCSKTMIGKALATESKLNFIAIKGPELFNKWVGESERAVREIFRKAKQAAPAILFFDEIDALAAERGSSSGSSNVGDRVLAQLLTEIDGVEMLSEIIVVAATNRPDIIDSALLRPGRLDRIVYVPLPDETTRIEIFNIRTKKMPLAFQNGSKLLAAKTDGYSGAEITAVCQEAGLRALENNIDATTVTLEDFEKALDIVRPRTSLDKIRFYEEYAARNKMVK